MTSSRDSCKRQAEDDMMAEAEVGEVEDRLIENIQSETTETKSC